MEGRPGGTKVKTVCEVNKCAGCMVCKDICPNGAISVVDGLDAYNAVIQEDKCTECGACHHICQRNHPRKQLQPMKWVQGWAEDQELRGKCSSGGFAAAISRSFIENGGVVCSCTFMGGEFIFQFAQTIEETEKFVGSKYVKSNPSGIYRQIRERLKKGQRILFIGLPCQVSAVKNFIGGEAEKNLYTVDLICHGTPSPEMLEVFLKQYNCSLVNMEDIGFRIKTEYHIHEDNKGIAPKGVADRYSIAFLNALIQTENCYDCPYAMEARVSDLTLGDSWGSELALEEQKKGISLALCQTKKGMELLDSARLHLEPVVPDRAIASNHQLRHPSPMPEKRDVFFKGISTGRRFNELVRQCCPKQCFRQDIKSVLIKLRILQGKE